MSDLSPAQMQQITAAVYAVAHGQSARGRVFAGLRRQFAVASYRNIPAERLGEVLQFVRSFELVKAAPAPQPKEAPAPLVKTAVRDPRITGIMAAFDLVYERLVDLAAAPAGNPPPVVTRAIDEMCANANILETWLTMQYTR